MALVALLVCTTLASCTSQPEKPASSPPGSPSKTDVRVPLGPKSDRPNIVLLSTDDQSTVEMRWMPRTRRLLAAHGLSFDHALSPDPLCCPARAEILTGKGGQNSGVRYNSGRWGGYAAYTRGDNRSQNIAVWLRRQGYRTALVGKFLNGYDARRDGREPGWDHWNPTGLGTYSYYGTSFYNDGDVQRFPQKHVSDVVRDYTLRYIDEFANGSHPFFIWASDVGPHLASGPGFKQRFGRRWVPAIPARRHEDLFDDVPLPQARKPSFNEDVDDKPRALRHAAQSRRSLTHEFRQRIRTLQSVDEANARIIRELRRVGELDNTYVFFLSDNGYLLGEHRLRGKNFGSQEDLSVPLVVRGPGVRTDAREQSSVDLVDLAPTFLDIAGMGESAVAALRLDARSIVPLSRDTTAGAADTRLIQGGTASTAEMTDPRSLAPGWWWRGVATDDFVYQAWFNGDEALYDRRRDPFELENLVDLTRPGNPPREPSYAPVLEELRRRYALLQDCAGPDACERRFGLVTRK